jgi:RND family efflux transporter MFP subunit
MTILKRIRKIRFGKKTIILGIIAVILIGGVFYWQRSRARKNEVETAQIQKGTVKEELILSGEIQADEHVTLQFAASGLLNWVGVKEGDIVRKNQAIASLDSRQLKKNLEKYLNTYGKTRNTFEQTHDDNRNWELATNAEERERLGRIVANSQLDLDSAVLDVELQDLALKFSTLTTPIAGIVTHVSNPFAGVNIIATQAKFEVVNPQTIFFSVVADQTEVTQIKEGEAVVVILDSFSEKTHVGRVKQVAYTPKEDDVSTVYEIKVEFENLDFSESAIRIGMTGDARFTLKQKDNALYVPTKFVNSDDQGKYLNLGKKNNKVYIETGLEGEDVIEIIGEIQEGATVYD